RGQERPGGDEMTAKFDEALKNPPAGVQVWAACTAGQNSHELEGRFNNGVFLESLMEELDAVASGSLWGIPQPEDALPVDRLVKKVNDRMARTLAGRGLKQTSRLTGSEAAGGVKFDPDQAAAPEAAVAAGPVAGGLAPADQIDRILDEVRVPPIQ